MKTKKSKFADADVSESIAELIRDSIAEENALKQTEPGVTVLGKVSQTAFEQLELKSTDVLLDVGTGTGDTALAAASICCQVIGIDVSRKSLEKARQKAS